MTALPMRTQQQQQQQHLVGDDEQRLVGEQRLDGVEQRRLLRDGVPALLADVHDVQHCRPQVRQRRDALRAR